MPTGFTKIETMRTWPIAFRTQNDFALIGIPARLGDGELYCSETFAAFPNLEEVVGEEWGGKVLSELLPANRPWAWWTRSEVIAKSGLRGSAAPTLLSITGLGQVLIKRLYFRRMSLAIVATQRSDQQALVREWAGLDTEHTPELIWSAPDGVDTWDVRFIIDWSRNRKLWQDPLPLIGRYAERLVMLFDGDIYCALSAAEGQSVLQRLGLLAAEWDLEVIPGPEDYAWVTGPIGSS